MRATERKEIGRALTLVLAGDRSGAAAVLRLLREPAPRSTYDARQLVLYFTMVRCARLSGEVPAHVCASRQIATDIQRTQQTSRGQGTDYPSCDSRKCPQGRRIREALDPRAATSWRGSGPGGRFQKARRQNVQAAARARLASVGLLDEVPTVDGNPAGEE